MAAEKPNRAEVAMALEDDAATTLQKLVEDLAPFSCDADVIAVAQAQATLALGQRLADLTDKLGEYFGDDSHLDGLKREVRDGLDAIRADGIGVG